MADTLTFEDLIKSAPQRILIQETTNSVESSIELAKSFAEKEVQAGDIICLIGDLGAGKTHFTKGIASAFEIKKEEVQSPTFTLINEYLGRLELYHFDLYRLKSTEEAIEIGIEEYLYGDGICVIEWPEKIAELLVSHFWLIEIKHLNPKSRSVTISQISHEA